MGISINAPELRADADAGEVIARAGTMDVRMATSSGDIEAAQRLRFEVFFEEMGARSVQSVGGARIDKDRFDEVCDHLIVVDHGENGEASQVVGTYRLLMQNVAERTGGFYSANEFDIAPLLERKRDEGPFLELGRSCVHPGYRNRPTIELLWRGILAYADRHGAEVLFGCVSLPGVDPKILRPQLSVLHHHALAPEDWRVRPHAHMRAETNLLAPDAYDAKTAFRALPPLVKGYVRVGCWFSDGAFVDRQFRTTDMLIALPRAQMSPRYKNRLGVGKWRT